MPDLETPSAFGSYGRGVDTERSWLSSILASSGVYVLLGVLIASVATTRTIIERKKPVRVKFVERVVKPPPPPPTAPKPIELKPPPPDMIQKQAAPAPAVPKDMKVRKLDKPPPPKDLVAPKDMPLDAAPEVDASLDQGVAVYGDGPGDAAGLEGGGVPGGVVPNPDSRAIAAVRPDPPYPAAALSQGSEGSVVLRCVVLASGKTHSCEVVEGDEPFVSSAIETIKSRWAWDPAQFHGRPVNVVESVVVNFRIQVS